MKRSFQAALLRVLFAFAFDRIRWSYKVILCDFYMLVRYLSLLRGRYSLRVYGENLPRDFQRNYETAR